ncbi:SDR family oxidoreductase [Aurantimonas sp. MSK8Z-1]|uniref:NAD-dependent epimerase/dehydratase family protein n=1 Tax=Mangrovibrevibacter kandeliae TaxID=2968473 RepID=UPI0021175A7E|nr:SDR family oxidoreductase [Aurantimonas sp. MSK8Z-1]MCW4117012.1 SDR family oxidoreductase [Aurantimonas sp. MSK8Z-1]
MLTHHRAEPALPDRTVVIGANSFVGKALIARLADRGAAVVPLTRSDVDLTASDAGDRLAERLQPGDSVVAVAAKAPCRNADDFLVNARIIASLARALQARPVAHLLNISSDAVYGDEPVPLDERVAPAPGSMHGVMHLAREIALGALGLPLAILRPTLIYGASDPHNGYGPNQFRRKANRGETITLFGEGEERRDHVDVADVAELAARILMHRSIGVLNAASGTVTSFRDVAQAAVRLSGRNVSIEGRPRSGPMPHNGYRPFDPTATTTAFPDFSYTDLESGMTAAQATEFAHG